MRPMEVELRMPRRLGKQQTKTTPGHRFDERHRPKPKESRSSYLEKGNLSKSNNFKIRETTFLGGEKEETSACLDPRAPFPEFQLTKHFYRCNRE